MALVVPVLCLLGLLAAWVVFPLLPAVIIYKLFPDTKVKATGPLAHLTVAMSGAFAAYMLVFLLIAWLVNVMVKVTTSDIEAMMSPSWTVEGDVQLVDQDGSTILRRDLLKDMELDSIPKCLDHAFERLTLSISQDRTGELPKILINVPNWGSQDVDLNGKKRDEYTHQITLVEVKIPRTQLPLIYNSQAPIDRNVGG